MQIQESNHTNLNINEELLNQAIQLTGLPTATETIEQALITLIAGLRKSEDSNPTTEPRSKNPSSLIESASRPLMTESANLKKMEKVENPFNYDLNRMKERVEDEGYISIPKFHTAKEVNDWLEANLG